MNASKGVKDEGRRGVELVAVSLAACRGRKVLLCCRRSHQLQVLSKSPSWNTHEPGQRLPTLSPPPTLPISISGQAKPGQAKSYAKKYAINSHTCNPGPAWPALPPPAKGSSHQESLNQFSQLIELQKNAALYRLGSTPLFFTWRKAFATRNHRFCISNLSSLSFLITKGQRIIEKNENVRFLIQKIRVEIKLLQISILNRLISRHFHTFLVMGSKIVSKMVL